MAEYQITHVHIAHPGNHPSNITAVWLKNGARPYPVSEIVDAIHSGQTFYYTIDGKQKAFVTSEHSHAGTWFIRTHPDSTVKDNLLNLDKF
ncbi:DUF3892 domain-containing protein [Alicyclobacillus fodiniaquatilis]|uniref:DUF3892 domain-containing protein n=1 Tax=Alicyclobacillus fodiniaquatilis TaxID=1661150 RepID=A0ABW4JJP5_9BACL